MFLECKPGAVLYFNHTDRFFPPDIKITGLHDHAFRKPCLMLGQEPHEHVEISPVLAPRPATGAVFQLGTTNASKAASSNDADANPLTQEEQADQPPCAVSYIP